MITWQLAVGNCLVLFDGLDEVATAQHRHQVVNAVMDFVTAHSHADNRFVVTSRISGHLAAPLPHPFQAVRLNDMSPGAISRFLDVYYHEIEKAEQAPKDIGRHSMTTATTAGPRISVAAKATNAAVAPPDLSWISPA